MATKSKLRLLSLSFTLLVLFHGCLALRHRNQQRQQQKNECQINRLEALKPDNRVEYEAGVVETWNPNEDQFQCAGVAMLRITIQPNGLHLPSFSNSPRLIYIVEGEGIIGALAPGCPETYQEPQQMSPGREMRGSFQQDQHQKIRRFRRGDIIALPAGVAYWTYNDANTDVVAVSLFDVTNDANQLDQIPRRFHLAGNPRQEFQQQRQTHERQPFRERGRGRGQEQRSYNNIFARFDAQLLAEAFNVEERLIRVLQNERDGGAIVSVRGELGVITPPRSQRFDEEEERGGGRRRGRHSEGEREREQRERRGREGRRDNGLEESICTMKIRTNIGDPSKADFYTPQAGHISTVNGVDLPILRWLQLSAEKGTLYNNAMVVPHWHPNAHSIVYVIRGTARFQLVDNMGNPVLDEEVREGQILTIPQNFAVVKQAISERFEWVALRTNCNSMTSPLAGRTSVIRGMPDEVLANAFGISREDARRLKYGNQQTHLTCGSSQMRRAIV